MDNINKTIEVICPKCGFNYDPVWYLPALAKARSYFGADYQRVTAYLDLFRRTPRATMNLSKRLRLLREVAKIVEEGGYMYDGQGHIIDRHAALECMDNAVATMAKRHAYGLKNHNYWKQVMRSKGSQVMADLRDRELKEKEKRIMSGRGHEKEDIPANIPIPALKTVDLKPGEMDRIAAAGREVMNIIQAGERRPEILARVYKKHNVDPHKIHQWVDEYFEKNREVEDGSQ